MQLLIGGMPSSHWLAVPWPRPWLPPSPRLPEEQVSTRRAQQPNCHALLAGARVFPRLRLQPQGGWPGPPPLSSLPLTHFHAAPLSTLKIGKRSGQGARYIGLAAEGPDCPLPEPQGYICAQRPDAAG